MTVDSRETRSERAQNISLQKGAIKRNDENTYTVKSQSGNAFYLVTRRHIQNNTWECNCPDHIYRHVKCKHIMPVEYSTELRNEVESTVKYVISPLSTLNCRYCNSTNIVRDGIRHNKYGDIQKYNCKDCDRYFTINIGFEWMHATPQMITTAMQLYFSGESFRNIQKFLKL